LFTLPAAAAMGAAAWWVLNAIGVS
jgi:hypothetical protein